MRVRFASAVGLAWVVACTLATFFGLLSNPAFAQINSTSPVLGLDVYGGNGTMNWSQIAGTGIQFAMVKATQGDATSDNYQDPQLANNESGATANGIYIGAYDFADPSTVTPAAEASYFVNYAQQFGSFNTGKLLPMLDMENDQGPIAGASSLNAWINAWQADVFSLTGLHPMLYVNPNYINSFGLTPSGTGISSLWLADWDWVNPTRPPSNAQMAGRSPPTNSWSPFSTWTFWQYSDFGSVNGDPDTAVDVDGFNGTLAQLVANEVIPALTWSGNTNGTWNNATTGLGSGTKNWIYGTSGTTQALYYDGRAVIFQDTNLVKSSQVTNSAVSIASTVTPQSMTFTANNVNYTFTGAEITGTGGLTLNGTGSVTLNNATAATANSFSGAIAINKGQLILDQAWSTGATSGITVASGSALVLNNTSGSATTFGNQAGTGGIIPVSLSGTGVSSGGALQSMKGNNTFGGQISLAGNTTITSASTTVGDQLNIAGGITTNGHTLTIGGSGITNLSTAISNTGSLVLNGGTLRLSAPAEIGVNIAADAGTAGSSSGEQPETLGSALAGVVPMSNWNDFVITRYGIGGNKSSSNPPLAQSVPTSSTPFTLTDATGASTTAQVASWSGSNTFSAYGSPQTVPNAQLENGFLGALNDNAHPNVAATLTINNVPYSAGYNVYVYFTNNNPGTSNVQGQVSLTSGTYSSSTYYVQMEGPQSATTTPFFVSGTSSTTAGIYTTSNYVEISVPAQGTAGVSSNFTITLASPPTGANQVTPGLAGVQIVANGAGATFSNPVSLSSNSTIDVTGVNSATMGSLSIGTKTLSVTGGSTGANAPYTLTVGATTLTGNATFDVANNTSGSATGTLNLGAIGDGGSDFGISLTGPGVVALTSSTGSNYRGATNVSAGTLQLADMGSNSSDSATGSGSVTVGGSGTIAGPTNASGNAYIAGAVSVNSGGTIATGGGAIATSRGLSLASGAAFDVALPQGAEFSTPQVTAAGLLALNENLAINVTQASGFTAGFVYPLIHYGSLSDNSVNQTGWTISGGPASTTPAIFIDNTANNLNLAFIIQQSSYNAASGAPGSQFGTTASWSVANGSAYADHISEAASQSTGGVAAANGYGPLLTTDGAGHSLYGEILAGNNSGNFTGGGTAPLQMSWRNRTAQETTGAEGGAPTAPPLLSGRSGLISNVLNVGGMSTTSAEPVQSDPFVLQMNYASALLANEAVAASTGQIYLAWLNPNGGGSNLAEWQNATGGNFGSKGADVGSLGLDFQGSFNAYLTDEETLDPTNFPGDPAAANLTNGELNLLLGAYGVDTSNNSAWAVLNHNSEFAVTNANPVPEPSTIALAAFALLAGLFALRHRIGLAAGAPSCERIG